MIESDPSDDELSQLMTALGAATFQAQSLEYQVVTLFATCKLMDDKVERGSDTIRKLMDTRYKQTLGRLIRDAASELRLNPQLADQLEVALQDRNWLIHNFYRDFGPVAVSRPLYRAAMERLLSVRSILEETVEAVYEVIVRRFSETGLDEKELATRALHSTSQYVKEYFEPPATYVEIGEIVSLGSLG